MSDGAQFRQVSPVRLYQRIVEQIEQAIVRGDLKPGQRLPSERELVTQFGASRPTVREALRVLESDGLVRSRPGDPNGPEILPFSSAGLTKQMTRLVQFDNVSMAELISFRMILDGSASSLAARLRSEEELSAMERTIAVMSDAIEAGYEEFSKADVAFHEAVAVAGRNSLIEVCNQVVRGAVLALISDKVAHADNSAALMRESLRHHQEVLEAIRAGDGRAAARISRRKLYEYYAGYVPENERGPLLALVEDEES
ncbi:FadR/GntR family transcriptional regulator [Streptomyces rhizosphaericus]|uniref:FadR family transcriptional regulator n=1 Tax=Streptomyces rhizosphaericus TaxID=114699 RepID=A0A6G4ACC3_9ACTN|nr:FadR/GntR family transcriptional regulator [Streptomyces rhizosphaericus]NEW70868.1 FadR family transcriptional regulator [Streptomyces rhizosphaericus]